MQTHTHTRIGIDLFLSEFSRNRATFFFPGIITSRNQYISIYIYIFVKLFYFFFFIAPFGMFARGMMTRASCAIPMATVARAASSTSSSTPTSAQANGRAQPGEWVASDMYHRSSTRFHTSSRPALEKLETVENPRHHSRTLSDFGARWLVHALRWGSDLYFANDYVRRAVMLETVAAVPGMVASVMHHLKSLRTATHSHWVKPLMDEAENERMHLMSMVEIWQPSLLQRATIFGVQMAMVSAFSVFYVLAPRMAHRFVGHLEEEAVITYTHFLEAIDRGDIRNQPAPKLARDYWSLPADATLRDLVLVIRADEADHRDVNHYLANVHCVPVNVLKVDFHTKQLEQ
jgi:ubiquinol oxidase